MDPYAPAAYDGAIGHAPVRERADVVTVSHEQHEDHAWVAGLPGAPLVIKAPGETDAAGFRVISRRLPHDAARGRRLGWTVAHRVEAGGVSVLHLGDVGDEAAVPADLASDVDVLLVPVGGGFTIGPREAARLVRRLAPRVAVPMHFRGAKVSLPLLPVRDFLEAAGGGEAPGVSEIEVGPLRADGPTRVVTLEASL
jgi:L-ascorbate metabolism protein UlaG (beta-lactamase superfamily)